MTTPAGTAGPGRRLARWARALRGTGGLRLLAAAAGGLTLYAAFAPSTLWWAAIVGIALLGLSVYGVRGRSGYGLALVFGLTFYLPLLNWSGVYVGSLPWVALAVAEALLTGLVGILLAWAARRLPWWPIWAAAAWGAGEALRARFPFGGFPWGSLAFSQPDGPLVPAASLLGSAGLTFVTALAGFSLAVLLRRCWGHRRTLAVRVLVLPLVLLVVAFGLGLAGRLTMVSQADAASYPHRTIAVIQGNVPKPGLDFNARRMAVTDNHAQRTHELAAAVHAGTAPQPDLVIWPENSSDIDPYTNADAAQVISDAVDDIGVPVLIGAVVGTDQPHSYYNMGIVWYPGTGPGETYIKRHPIPFGEYMPWRSFFRIFSDKVDLLTGQFLPGSRVGNFDVAGIPFGDLICFEVVEDGLTRDVVNGGAQVLVVQTNNATFGWTDETYQQQAMSRVRAVEHGRSVLIAATSGVSAVIRPDGSVESKIPLFTPGYLVPSVPLIDRTTPGTVLGAWVEWLVTIATPLALLWLFVAARRRDRVGSRPGKRDADQHRPTDHRTPGDDIQEDASP
ncbi:apolipoprotein N-acyltransferase [Nakamurella lactea]|uniref:apolipoprotein N-acyltransferase n=1 Tax=Nakamurella lactea TaxID=459515 RepID=UPI000A01E412|nr:apolipoprotein N-acyltransferase [Nakamurella lactea]